MKTLKALIPNDILYEVNSYKGIREVIIDNIRDEGVFTRFYIEEDTHCVVTKHLPNITWFGNFYCNKQEAIDKLLEECDSEIKELKERIEFFERVKENETNKIQRTMQSK